jgi:hypothetical protein
VDHINVELHLYINKINTPSNPSTIHLNRLHIPIKLLLINLTQINLISIDHNLINHYLIPSPKHLQLHSINQRGSMVVDNLSTRFSPRPISNLKVMDRRKDMDAQLHHHPLSLFKILSINMDMGKLQGRESQVSQLPTSTPIPTPIPRYPKTRGEVQCLQSSLLVYILYRGKIHLVGPLVLSDISFRSQFPIYKHHQRREWILIRINQQQ